MNAAAEMNQSFAGSPLPMMGLLALMALVPFAVARQALAPVSSPYFFSNSATAVP